MSKDTQYLTPLQMLERLNQAIVESGIDQMVTEREPVDIFRSLLKEWFISKDSSWQAKAESEIFVLLLQKHSLTQLQKAMRKVYNETLELSMAHRSLTAWTRRELEQEFQRIQNIVEQAVLKQKGFG